MELNKIYCGNCADLSETQPSVDQDMFGESL